LRFAAGKGTQLSLRRGQANAGQTVGHLEVADIAATIQDLLSRDVPFLEYATPKTTNFIAQIGTSEERGSATPTATCSDCTRARSREPVSYARGIKVGANQTLREREPAVTTAACTRCLRPLLTRSASTSRTPHRLRAPGPQAGAMLGDSLLGLHNREGALGSEAFVACQ
jgi:hypothetical protein